MDLPAYETFEPYGNDVAIAPSLSDYDAPPSYESAIHNSTSSHATFRLVENSTRRIGEVPTSEECANHLRLLEAFYELRIEIGTTSGLYGISNSCLDTLRKEDRQEFEAKLNEKRWAIFVAQAVNRFEKWWFDVLPHRTGPEEGMLRMGELQSDEWNAAVGASSKRPVAITRDFLPPLDVLMVWHTFMLNPRCFLEDCARYGKLSFWASGMPWQAVMDSIDSRTYEYRPSEAAITLWTSSTGMPWDSVQRDPYKELVCPACSMKHHVPLTTFGEEVENLTKEADLLKGRGFCDRGFQYTCECGVYIDSKRLCVFKFIRDAQRTASRYDQPMPGTIISVNGMPEKLQGDEELFPNALVAIFQSGLQPHAPGMKSMENVKAIFEKALSDKGILNQAKSLAGIVGVKTNPVARRTVRLMLSRYNANPSPFTLDLVGAVLRQAAFVEKMHKISWLSTPTLSTTMARTITKYNRFWRLLADRTVLTVPTLDVDLAWHTHQLTPYAYLTWSVTRTKRTTALPHRPNGDALFVDHDDRIAESALSDAFTSTSQRYAEAFNEPYAECACWYCEAVRESSSKSRLFSKSPNWTTSFPADVETGPHISAHNAVDPAITSEYYRRHVEAKNMKLLQDYERTARRASKSGRTAPPKPDLLPFAAAYVDPGVCPDRAIGSCASGACGGGGMAAGMCSAVPAQGAAPMGLGMCGGGVGTKADTGITRSQAWEGAMSGGRRPSRGFNTALPNAGRSTIGGLDPRGGCAAGATGAGMF